MAAGLAKRLRLARRALLHELEACARTQAAWADARWRKADLQPLEAATRRLLAALGAVDTALHALSAASSAAQRREARRVAEDAMDVLHSLCCQAAAEAAPGSGTGSGDEIFERRVRHGARRASGRDALGLPAWYWLPEAVVGACLVAAGGAAWRSGAVHAWLHESSLSRRAGSQPAPVLAAGLVSLEALVELGWRAADKALRWARKQVRQHVATPARNLVGELVNRRELFARVTLFNAEDAAALADTEAKIRALGAATSLEALSHAPLHAALDERRWAVLGNMLWLKAEVLHMLRALDVLLRRSNFNLELAAALPALLVAALARSLLCKRPARAGRELRLLLRDLDQLHNRLDLSNPLHVGQHALLMHRLELLLGPLLPARRPLGAALAELSDPWKASAWVRGGQLFWPAAEHPHKT